MSEREPLRFSETFTIYRNAEGQPVERAVGNMTAGEVLTALEWSGTECDRLVAEVEANVPELAAALRMIEA